MVVDDDDVGALTHRPTLPPVVIRETYREHGRAGKDTPHYGSTLRYISHGLVVISPQRVCVMAGMFYTPGRLPIP